MIAALRKLRRLWESMIRPRWTPVRALDHRYGYDSRRRSSKRGRLYRIQWPKECYRDEDHRAWCAYVFAAADERPGVPLPADLAKVFKELKRDVHEPVIQERIEEALAMV